MIGNNAPVDTTNNEPDPEFDTSLRVLEVRRQCEHIELLVTLGQIDNDLVRKQLIINQMIEQTVLHENRRKLLDILSESRLQNVKQCLTPNNNGSGSRFSYGWGGGLAEGYIPQFKGSARMKTDVEFQIK